MSSHKILAFLVSVYALLAGICLLVPQDGIKIGPATLNFPTLAEVKEIFAPKEKEPAGPTPEELLEQRMAAVKQAEKDRFRTYFTTSPARMYLPKDDLHYFDAFFSSLEKADRKHVRILHYGDSQIEEDRITGAVRAGLQERFGGGGPGLMPFGRPYYTQGFSQSSTANLRRYLLFGEGSRRSDGRYGIMGQMSRCDTSVYTSVAPVKSNKTVSRHFNRLTLLANGKLNVKLGGKQYSLATTGKEVGRLVISLPDSSTVARWSTWGSADIYGFQLDDSLGVSMDNIPMRGCSGTVFTRINREQIQEYARNDNVRLVILQFGGNAMPYRKSEKSISEYKEQLKKQIEYLHELIPGAAILFVGPSDMSTSVRGKMQTYPHLPMMVDSLRAAANESGAAFWDMYSAMGGENSMVQWVKARPALAGSDYVHFTPKGAEAIGNLLLESLMLYYDYYKWRKDGGR